jgi:DNA-binding response OmpR family regulator
MFALDPRLQARLKVHMSRILVLEENHAYGRMLADMMRILGAEQVMIVDDNRKAMAALATFEPQIILTEYKTALIDGAAFTHSLRHSTLSERRVPVIMLKADITPQQLLEARNAGVHEVLKKPFAWQDLVSRLQNVLFKPRDWVEVSSYTGPDRRRFNTAEYKGPKRRRAEIAETPERIALEEAVRLLKAAIESLDIDAPMMMTTIMQQMAVIVPAAKTVKSADFTRAAMAMVAELRNGTAAKVTLLPQLTAMMESLGMDKMSTTSGARELFVKGLADVEADAARLEQVLDGDPATPEAPGTTEAA